MSGVSGPQGRFGLPDDTAAYRTIGPFGSDSLPKGLLREHRLKEGTWGRLRVLSGKIRFVWDDDGADHAPIIGDRETVIIPPIVPHHIERLATDFVLEIDFLEQGNPLPAPEDDRNGVASEWRLVDNEPATAVICSLYRAPSAPDPIPVVPTQRHERQLTAIPVTRIHIEPFDQGR